MALVICFCITIITANIDNKDFYMNYINADFYKSYELEQVLYEIAKQNCHNSISVENGKEAEETLKNMDLSTIEKVGIMAGASTPKESIDEVIKVWHLFK